MLRPDDKVRLAALPDFVARLPAESRRVFAACVGQVFAIEAIEGGLLVLDVSELIDPRFGGYKNDIRVEPRWVSPA